MADSKILLRVSALMNRIASRYDILILIQHLPGSIWFLDFAKLTRFLHCLGASPFKGLMWESPLTKQIN